MFVEDQLKKNVSENTPITNNIQWWGCPIIEPPDTEMLLAVSQNPDYKIWQTSNFSLELALVELEHEVLAWVNFQPWSFGMS
jgi:hypothetical protein